MYGNIISQNNMIKWETVDEQTDNRKTILHRTVSVVIAYKFCHECEGRFADVFGMVELLQRHRSWEAS